VREDKRQKTEGKGQKFGTFLIIFAFCLLPTVCFLYATSRSVTRIDSPRSENGKHGGRLVISKSAGPRTFNRILSFDDQTNTVSACLMGHLIRINRQTQQPEAELARLWKISPDGKTLTFHLRREVKFSDGTPFTADDVIFTFQVINDPKIKSSLTDLFNIEGQRVKVEKLDSHTIRFNFPIAYAAAVRLFDGIPILARHILEPAYRDGKFEQAWTISTPPERIVGLGPFKLKAYVPGQRVTLIRNEQYWKTDAEGKRFPYLDEVVFNIDPDRNTQLLKFQHGKTDLLSPINAEDAPSLAELEREGRIKVFNLGPSLIRETLWFNLNDGKQANGQAYVDPSKLGWFQEVKFRQAISHAIDRTAVVNLVFAGKADPQWAFLSAGDQLWFNPEIKSYPYDINRARNLLAEAGFRFQAEKKQLLDRQGRPVSFTLITNAGNALRQKMGALIQEDLARLGIKVNLVFIESRALLKRINQSFDYEACLLAIASGDVEPSSHLNILLSRGANHWWNPSQSRPATDWEAKIDKLMTRQIGLLNLPARKKIFDEAQMILAEQQPFIFLASRHLIVAAKSDIGNLKPALLPDYVLWNSEELFWKRQALNARSPNHLQ
jgi:peptide/nickel transport system substrate-binding protein